jgi:hypothetical protein
MLTVHHASCPSAASLWQQYGAPPMQCFQGHRPQEVCCSLPPPLPVSLQYQMLAGVCPGPNLCSSRVRAPSSSRFSSTAQCNMCSVTACAPPPPPPHTHTLALLLCRSLRCRLPVWLRPLSCRRLSSTAQRNKCSVAACPLPPSPHKHTFPHSCCAGVCAAAPLCG